MAVCDGRYACIVPHSRVHAVAIAAFQFLLQFASHEHSSPYFHFLFHFVVLHFPLLVSNGTIYSLCCLSLLLLLLLFFLSVSAKHLCLRQTLRCVFLFVFRVYSTIGKGRRRRNIKLACVSVCARRFEYWNFSGDINIVHERTAKRMNVAEDDDDCHCDDDCDDNEKKQQQITIFEETFPDNIIVSLPFFSLSFLCSSAITALVMLLPVPSPTLMLLQIRRNSIECAIYICILANSFFRFVSKRILLSARLCASDSKSSNRQRERQRQRRKRRRVFSVDLANMYLSNRRETIMLDANRNHQFVYVPRK